MLHTIHGAIRVLGLFFGHMLVNAGFMHGLGDVAVDQTAGAIDADAVFHDDPCAYAASVAQLD